MSSLANIFVGFLLKVDYNSRKSSRIRFISYGMLSQMLKTSSRTRAPDKP